MIKVLVVSDDMTGNNDTGALLKQIGLDTVAAISDHISSDRLEGKDALCLNTDSRAMLPDAAKEKVRKAVRDYWKSGMLCCKRIDSTMRGNVGSEIDGMLDALPKGFKAVVVPAFPRAGRVCVGGHMLVHGIALTSSGAGRDPKTPVHSSRVTEIIALQSSRRIQSIFLQEIQEDREKLAETIRESDAEILVMDAVSEADIERIADACRLAQVAVACVDPGSFSVRMAQGCCEKKSRDLKNLLVIGSLSEVTRRQVVYFIKKKSPLLYRVSAARLLADYETVKKEAVEFLSANMGAYENICLLTDEEAARDEAGTETGIHAAEEISRRFTQIGAEFFNRCSKEIACIYLCGGDIAKDFMENLQIEAIDIMDEVIPLAVYGKMMDKDHKAVQVLTKGGMIGEESTICDMINYAKKVR